MKKNVYHLDNIDCAACGLKVEDYLKNIDGVIFSSLDVLFLKLFVTFNEEIITDEEIENAIHKSLRGVKIVKKNNILFEDNYSEGNILRKILFKNNKTR